MRHQSVGGKWTTFHSSWSWIMIDNDYWFRSSRSLTALMRPANDRLLLIYTTSITHFLVFYHQRSLSSQVRLLTFTSIFFFKPHWNRCCHHDGLHAQFFHKWKWGIIHNADDVYFHHNDNFKWFANKCSLTQHYVATFNQTFNATFNPV